MKARCQHVALFARDLDAFHRFYRDVLEFDIANYSPDYGVLAISLTDGFILRYERTGQTVGSASVRFIGLELESPADVDRMFDRLIDRGITPSADLRESYMASSLLIPRVGN